mgnify:CR=1 FL=1
MVRKKINIAEKKKHFNFVMLSEKEHSDLCERLGPDGAADWIEELDLYLGSKGDKYESHYYTILAWARRKAKKDAATRGRGDAGTTASADRLIEDLKANYTMPAMPADARDKVFAVLIKLKTNWPVLRSRLLDEPETEARIRAAYAKQ